MKFRSMDLPEVLLCEPKVFGDARGYFLETWRADLFRDAGVDLAFVQDNQSSSSQGVLRGIHYQIRQPQGKLVRGGTFGRKPPATVGTAGIWPCLLRSERAGRVRLQVHGFLRAGTRAGDPVRRSGYRH